MAVDNSSAISLYDLPKTLFSGSRKNTARPFDEITGDGTVVYGVFEPKGGDTREIAHVLEERFQP